MWGEVVDDWKCQEVNVLVFYFNPVIKITSNVSKFVVENTYGVNLIPTSDSFSMSAGIAFHFNCVTNTKLWSFGSIMLSNCFIYKPLHCLSHFVTWKIKEGIHKVRQTGLYIKQIFQLDNMILPKLQSFVFGPLCYSPMLKNIAHYVSQSTPIWVT